jgi:hypothetical protein
MVLDRDDTSEINSSIDDAFLLASSCTTSFNFAKSEGGGSGDDDDDDDDAALLQEVEPDVAPEFFP